MYSATRLLVVTIAAGVAAFVFSPDQFQEAERQFERHNYQAALDLVQAHLDGIPEAQHTPETLSLRVRCMLKLRRWDEGVGAAEQLFKQFPATRQDASLHMALADAGRQSYQHRFLEITHLPKAVELFEKSGDRESAADAAIQCGEAFVRFNDWNRVTDQLDIEPPSDWRASRRLQREFAVKWLDRGIDLTKDADKVAAAMLRKASLFHRELYLDESDGDVAIKIYRDLVSRYPKSREAPAADLQIGVILDQSKGDYVAAETQYRQTVERYPGTPSADRASGLLKNLTAPMVNISVEGPTLPGRTPHIDWESRNVKQIRFRAYRIDLFKVARELVFTHNIGNYVPRDEPVASWTFDVPDRGDHKFFGSIQHVQDPIEAPLTDSGAYVVIADFDGAAADANKPKALLIVSRLAALTKSGQQEATVWTADAVTGEPVGGADVLVIESESDRPIWTNTGVTDETGLFTVGDAGDVRQHSGQTLTVYVAKGDDYALAAGGIYWMSWSRGDDYRMYSVTDRPVYRPNQTIHFKHVLRRYVDSDYALAGHVRLDMKVVGPKGDVVDERPLTTNEHGIAVGELTLSSTAALGMYHIQIQSGGRYIYPGQGGTFRLEEYRKPEFEVTVTSDTEKTDIHEPIDARIEARYYFGSPVVGGEVSYTVYRAPMRPSFPFPTPYPWYFEQLSYWWRSNNSMCMPAFCRMPHVTGRSLVERGTLSTDESGTAILRITSGPDVIDDPQYADGVRYIVEADVTDSSRRTVSGSGDIDVGRKPFVIQLQPERYFYQPGDTVQIDVRARNLTDQPISFTGTMTVQRLVPKVGASDSDAVGGRRELIPEGVIERQELSGGNDGLAAFRFVADEEGPLRFALSCPTDAGKTVTESVDVWIAKRGGRLSHYAYSDIELIVDKFSYAIGDTARILINTRSDDAYVFLSTEADNLMDHRIVHVTHGSAVVEIPIESRHAPNFYISATMFRDNKVYQDQQAVVVPPAREFLTVGIDSAVDTFGPGDESQIQVTTRDWRGDPVDADITLMMVDASIYHIQPEFREQIERYFYGQIRYDRVQTQTSFDVTSYGRSLRRSAGDESYMMQASGQPVAKTMAPSASADAAGGPAEPSFAVAQIRRSFPDTALWIGHLNTGPEGRERIRLNFPDTLTTWRLIAIAVDDETRVGETHREFITRKDVIARLQTPRFLVEGDDCRITVNARNELPEQKTARVSLKTSGPVTIGQIRRGDEELPLVGPATVEIDIPSGGEETVDFDAKATGAGSATFTAGVATDVESDAIERNLDVLAFGSAKLVSQTGVLRGRESTQEGTVRFNLPREMDPDTPILEVHISPTIAGVMIDAIPYLLDYPYGCVEQTMSRFLPAVATRRALEKMGVQLDELRKLASVDESGKPRDWRWNKHPVFNQKILDDIVAVGLARLTDMQHADGGWGWWQGGPSDPYMSAYVAYGLAEAKLAGIAFDTTMLDRASAFLKRCAGDATCLPTYGEPAANSNVVVWLLYALSASDVSALNEPQVRDALERVYTRRDDLSDYGRALLALVLHKTGDAARAGIVVENLQNTVRIDRDTDTASWGAASGYYRWYRNGLESTAMVLRALLAIAPDDANIARAATWLVRNRQGARWASTKDTAFAIYALAEYLEHSGELEADMTVRVTYDNDVGRTFRITPENLLTSDARMIFAPRHLTPGAHTVHIEKQGNGHVYYGAYMDYYTKENPIGASGHELLVQRHYFRLNPKEVERTRRIWDFSKRRFVDENYRAVDYDRTPLTDGDAVTSGDLIDVELELDARNDFEYIIVEDPKPAGCEPTQLLSGGTYGDGFYGHMEMRDEHVAFFATYLPQKIHRLTYRLRCETPGTFHTLPTRVEAMYSPYVRANGSSDELVIKE